MIDARTERLLVFALAAAVLITAVVTVTPWPVGAYQDDAMYTVLAKSLAEGRGYRFLNLPGEPNATHFPPGYPAFLALLWRLWPAFPDNIVIFKFANAVWLALAAVGAYFFTRIRFGLSVPASLGVAAFGTLSIVVLLVTGVIMSEPMFMALLFPALLLAERVVDRGGARDAFLAGLALGSLGLVRTLGVFAIPAALLVLVMRRQWKSAVSLGVGATLVLLPWLVWVQLHQGEVAGSMTGKFGSYGLWLADGYREGGWAFARQVVVRNLSTTFETLSVSIMPFVSLWPRVLAMGAALVLMLAGTARFARNAPVSLGYLACYTFVVLIWPFEPMRFLLAVWPMWPLLVGCGAMELWGAMARVGARPVRRAGQAAVAVAVLALVAGSLAYNGIGYSRKWWVSVQRDAGKRAKPIVEWAARYTDSSDVLVTEDDLIVYLYANRKAIPPSVFLASQHVRSLSDAEDVQWVRTIFSEYKPNWFIVGSQQGFRTAATLAEGEAAELRFAGRTPDVLIYQRTKP